MQLDPLNDRLIPDPQVRQRYGVTDMTLWRWDHTPSLGFPSRSASTSGNSAASVNC